MHYLQTEFTKNERDRISWELEKFEMKSRIAQLEGENRDLRYNLSKIESKSPISNKNINEPHHLINSRVAVQENVKEIIYLLKNTNVNVLKENSTVLDPMANLHSIERLNANTNVTTTVDIEKEPKNSKDLLSTLVSNSKIHSIKKLKVCSNNSIIIAGDHAIESFHLNTLDLSKSNEVVYDGTSDKLFDMFSSNGYIVSIDDNNLMTRSITNPDILASTDFSDDETSFQMDQLKIAEFKNDWLLLVSDSTLQVKKLLLPASKKQTTINVESSKIIERNTISGLSKIFSATFGLTEKSVIVLYDDPLSLVIYDFEGSILQTIDLSTSIDDILDPLSTIVKLYLNKDSSKLLIQVDNRITCYSFDQRQIILKKSLSSIPLVVSFKFNDDYIAVSYDDGTVEVRGLNNFKKILMKYNEAGHPATSVDMLMINNSPIIISTTGDNKITVRNLKLAK